MTYNAIDDHTLYWNDTRKLTESVPGVGTCDVNLGQYATVLKGVVQPTLPVK